MDAAETEPVQTKLETKSHKSKDTPLRKKLSKKMTTDWTSMKTPMSAGSIGFRRKNRPYFQKFTLTKIL